MNRRVALIALAVLWPLGPVVAQPLVAPSQNPVTGARVFGEKGCVRCHAVNDVGGRVGPDLARLRGPRSFHDLAAAMWNHLPQMAERMRELGLPRPRPGRDAQETVPCEAPGSSERCWASCSA